MSEEKSAYVELLGELETLAKAMDDGKEDDKKILAAAGEAGEGEGQAKQDGEENGEENGDGDGDGDGDETLGKSFTAVIDGKEVEAVDGTALVKSLIGRVDASAAKEADMLKAMTTAVDLIKAQGEEIKMLKSEVARIGGTGQGRKSALTIHDKPAPAGSDTQPAVTAGDILAKANSAAEAGKITWREASKIDTAIRLGQAPDSALLSRIVQQ